MIQRKRKQMEEEVCGEELRIKNGEVIELLVKCDLLIGHNGVHRMKETFWKDD
ncbi:MAG: hypothetical protein ACREBJ_07320 [Nitrosotalea sp.]